MTREKEINIAASKYIEDNSMPDGWVAISDHKDSFIEGAEWADNHPKSPWISVDDDLPCNHEELTHSNYTDRVLISARNGFVEVAFMGKIENVWVWETPIRVSHWMPIPELPKE